MSELQRGWPPLPKLCRGNRRSRCIKQGVYPHPIPCQSCPLLAWIPSVSVDPLVLTGPGSFPTGVCFLLTSLNTHHQTLSVDYREQHLTPNHDPTGPDGTLMSPLQGSLSPQAP